MLGIVICRKASDYLKPGFVLGHACKMICGEPLQVSPLPLTAIAEGTLLPLCNPCGFAVEKRLRDEKAPMDIIFSAEATARMEELAAELRQRASNN